LGKGKMGDCRDNQARKESVILGFFKLKDRNSIKRDTNETMPENYRKEKYEYKDETGEVVQLDKVIERNEKNSKKRTSIFDYLSTKQKNNNSKPKAHRRSFYQTLTNKNSKPIKSSQKKESVVRNRKSIFKPKLVLPDKKKENFLDKRKKRYQVFCEEADTEIIEEEPDEVQINNIINRIKTANYNL
jgi:hypothetical protein